MRALLISTYEMGRQPFGLASPAAWLRQAGVDVTCLDLSRQPFRAELASADFVGFHLPMHTATRLAVPVIRRVLELNPRATLCCYGLYAPLNRQLLTALGVEAILGGEFEADLVALATGQPLPDGARAGGLPRLTFLVPDRAGLPPLSGYASLRHGRARRVVGYTEASRGCKHYCRHCPVVPIYNGQFRIVPVDVVLEDIRRQVEHGAQHITFGDPDFFNGIGHAMRVIESIGRMFPDVTYDVTIKIEHLLRNRDQLSSLRDTGCLFVTSAVESFDDPVFAALEKRHTSDDVRLAVAECRQIGLDLIPTFVAFTPWTTLDNYITFLEAVDRLLLLDHVAPIQLAIRLLVTKSSRLLTLPGVTACLEPFDPIRLVYPWRHPDPRVDQLCDEVGALVGRRLTATRRELFADIWEVAHRLAGRVSGSRAPIPPNRAEVPFLNEPWYC
jgi:radical SAM superfamily enzyme YgiQ (UPF0313 family)